MMTVEALEADRKQAQKELVDNMVKSFKLEDSIHSLARRIEGKTDDVRVFLTLVRQSYLGTLEELTERNKELNEHIKLLRLYEEYLHRG